MALKTAAMVLWTVEKGSWSRKSWTESLKNIFTSGQYGNHKTILYLSVLAEVNATLRDFRMIHSMLDRKKIVWEKKKMGRRQEEPGGVGFGVPLWGRVVRAGICRMKPDRSEGLTCMAIWAKSFSWWKESKGKGLEVRLPSPVGWTVSWPAWLEHSEWEDKRSEK